MVDRAMNPQIIAVGVISLIAGFVLFILEKTTPGNQRVPVKPFVTYSHESVRIQIIFLLFTGMIFVMIGLVL
jgi:hypothetical protein